jgi:hypothetical protein
LQFKQVPVLQAEYENAAKRSQKIKVDTKGEGE